MTGIAELLRGVGAQPSEAPPPLWDVPGVEPDFDVIVVGGRCGWCRRGVRASW